MRKNHFLFFVYFLLANFNAVAEEIACEDISKVDLKNAKLSIGSWPVQFAQGKGFAYLDFNEEEEEELRAEGLHPDAPEFSFDIVKDTFIPRVNGVAVRFLEVYGDHLQGSGWQYHLIGYKCQHGTLQEFFHRDALSLRVEQLDADTLVTSTNAKSGSDARKHYHYRWNVNKETYMLRSTNWTKPKKKRWRARRDSNSQPPDS